MNAALVEANRATLKQFTPGDKLMVTNVQGTFPVVFGIVTGFIYNCTDEAILCIKPIPKFKSGSYAVIHPQTMYLHPGNSMYTIEKL